ncbi:MAG: hypothetical protein ACK4RK_01445 [Gemmataceae bacterium]
MGLCLVLLVAVPTISHADLIFLKDGFVLHGRVRQQGETFVDPASGNSVWMPKGTYIVDADSRRILFSPQQVRDVDSRDLNRNADLVTLNRAIYRPVASRMEAIRGIVDVSNWDGNWERTFTVQTDEGLLRIPQRLTILTPHYVRIDALKYHWTSFYMTSELGPNTVRYLLHYHPDMMEPSGQVDPTKRLRMFRFLVQAGWYDAALEELNRLRIDAPDEKERVEEARRGLQQLLARQLLQSIELAHAAGRHQWAQERLKNFPRQDADEDMLRKVRSLLTQYDKANEDLAQAQRWLKELAAQVANAEISKWLEPAVQAILAELNIDNVSRLEAFVVFAKQAAQARERNQAPTQKPEELLALALTGWLMGNTLAETDVEAANRLWRARTFILNYQRAHHPAARQQLLREFEESAQTIPEYDELAHLAQSLPPAEPEPTITTQPVHMRTRLPNLRPPVSYDLVLPPEYHHGRSYPVLCVLHDKGETPRTMLSRWSAEAARRGYILVAPEWSTSGLQADYKYSSAEQLTVLDTLRDVLRRFNIDTNRIFLFGLGEGGTMAFDVGLSHPDLFAGVVPMSPTPRYHIHSYWPNAQYLPLYVVNGSAAGDPATKYTQPLFEKYLVMRGFPALYVEYKGRGLEWFSGEVANIFDWMEHKKRADGVPFMGREAFQTMREYDNRFYWLSTNSIDSRHFNDISKWNRNPVPASMQGQVREGNQIIVYTRGLRQVTVWINPRMVDFSKPVTIRINASMVWNNFGRPLKPSLETLMEDFYDRGDRNRLYLARVDFNKL